jgi:DNA-binding FadR family transcriptional regulator
VLTLFVKVLIQLTMEQQLPHAHVDAAVGAYRRAHDRLVDAIEARDPVTARRRMRRHLEAMALVIGDAPVTATSR